MSESESIFLHVTKLSRTYHSHDNSAVQQGRVMATQFHPEKSGTTGLRILKTFLDRCVRDRV